MYTKEEASRLRAGFWTSFGQYMRPVMGATGDSINWINYKTGIKNIFFRMDATNTHASIAIELHHTDPDIRKEYFEKFIQLKAIFQQEMGEEWKWELNARDEHGKPLSEISRQLDHVSIFRKEDWPAIISFLKPRIISLDSFWNLVKDSFE